MTILQILESLGQSSEARVMEVLPKSLGNRAARHLSPGGTFVLVFPVNPDEQELRVLRSASDSGFSIVRKRRIVFREGERPLLGLFCMMRSEDLPIEMREKVWTEPPLIIRCSDVSVHPEYSAIKMSFGFPP